MPTKLRIVAVLTAAAIIAWSASVSSWSSTATPSARNTIETDFAFLTFLGILAASAFAARKHRLLVARLAAGVTVGTLFGFFLRPSVSRSRTQIAEAVLPDPMFAFAPTAVAVGATLGGLAFLFWPEFSQWLNRVNERSPRVG